MKEDKGTSRPWPLKKAAEVEGGQMNEEMLRKMRAADPTAELDLERWAESDAGKRVYARIVSRRQEEARPRRRGSRPVRVILALGGSAVVVAAIVVGVVVGTKDSAASVAGSSSTTATLTVEAADGLQTLARVVTLVDAVQGQAHVEAPPPPEKDPAFFADAAVRLGMVLASERDQVLAPGSVSRATYCLWLWRGLEGRLTRVEEVSFSDLGALSDEALEAVLGIAGAGIVEGRSDGRFEPDRALSAEEEEEALVRLENALGLRR